MSRRFGLVVPKTFSGAMLRDHFFERNQRKFSSVLKSKDSIQFSKRWGPGVFVSVVGFADHAASEGKIVQSSTHILVLMVTHDPENSPPRSAIICLQICLLYYMVSVPVGTLASTLPPLLRVMESESDRYTSYLVCSQVLLNTFRK